MAKRKEKDEEPARELGEAISANQLRLALADRIARVLEIALRLGAIVLVVRYISHSIDVLAGKHTVADIGVKFLASVRVSEAVAWIFGASGVGYGYRQRHLRRKDTKQISDRLSKYEEKRDPRRSSTKLESQGDYGED